YTKNAYRDNAPASGRVTRDEPTAEPHDDDVRGCVIRRLVRAKHVGSRVPRSAAIASHVRAGIAVAPTVDSQGASARVKASLRRCAALTPAVRSLSTALVGAPALCD